jgi:uncharacterized damage-inducible protein DinB
MAQPVLTAYDLLAWLEKTSANWHTLLQANPEVLDLPCDVAGTTTAGELLQHIVAVELRYAERLAGVPATDYAAIAFDSPEAIYKTHRCAVALITEQLESDVDWDQKIDFVTRSMGAMRSSRKTILFHALLHSNRHYAQLATLVRQNGIKPDWAMDYLMMGAERVWET